MIRKSPGDFTACRLLGLSLTLLFLASCGGQKDDANGTLNAAPLGCTTAECWGIEGSGTRGTPPPPPPVGPAAVNFKSTGSMIVARSGHTATLLLDGNVLVVGGCDLFGGDYCSPYASSELYDPARGVFTAAGSMRTGRVSHTAVLLSDGKVLIAGGWGWNSSGDPDASAELYDPVTQSFSPTGSMTTSRVWHTATLLTSGKVLIAGGKATAAGPALASAELYDPATGSFSSAGNMLTARETFTATLLQNGKVLIAGGWNDVSPLALAELYDPNTGKFTPTGSMIAASGGPTATRLMSGEVLLAGGNPDGRAAEIYDPQAGTFTMTGNMVYARDHGTSATLLADGRVLLAGANPVSSGGWSTAELFDPASGSFLPAGSMGTRRAVHTATLLSGGQVLLSGGCLGATADGCTESSTTAELYQ